MIRSISLLALALSAPVADAQITATIESGYDNNPFRLADQFDSEAAAFLDAEIRLEHEFDSGFWIDGRARQLASQSDNAGQTSYAFTSGYQNEARLFGKAAEFEVHLRATGLDRTFVSRSTGEVGVFRGTVIPDRFDQNSVEGRARVDIALAESWTLRLQADGRSRVYEDYSALGLSNLDYDQSLLHARLRYWPEDRKVDGQVGLSLGRRVYDDRRGRALDTGLLPGTDLEFSYLNLDASWKHVVRRHHDVRFAYSYDLREDNVTGYYDTSMSRARVRYRYMPEWGNRFSVELEYRDFVFENIPSALIVNEEENVAPNDGFRLSLNYDRRLLRERDREVWLDLSLTHDDFDSPNAAFGHDRLVVRAGIVFEFG